MRGTSLAILVSLSLGGCAHAEAPRARALPPPAAEDATVELDWAPAEATEPPSLHEWRATYPDAARELADWDDDDPDGAAALAIWDERHPDQLHVLVLWAMTNPYDELGALFLRRSTWHALEEVDASYPDTVAGFVGWCRRAVPAAVELARHPAALAWFVESR